MKEQQDQSREKPTLAVLNGDLDRTAAGGGADGGDSPGERKSGEIYAGCPVQALGVYGELFYYLDIKGQLQAVKKHDTDKISALFMGNTAGLIEAYPKFGRESNNPTGWKHEAVREAMQRACGEKGVWNAFEKVRGLGAWPDTDGSVILHCGDAVLHRGKWKVPGEIEGYVYPSAPRTPRPLDDFPKTEYASELLQILETWNWRSGEIDAYLFLGWICSAMFGGALDWRALIWITGDAGTGKSTLQKLMRLVMGGEGAILQSTDATEASIRQFLLQSTIPVALDEIEAEADGRKAASVIKLARQAASGGVVLRGGSDHKGQEFKARSSFAFSSILIPRLLDQDISRLAVLELDQLQTGVTPPEITARYMMTIGRGLRTKIIESWDRLHETLELYRQALQRVGHSARGCDQFGTLLALADLAMFEEPPTVDRCAGWAQKLGADRIADQMDKTADWQQMLSHLMEQPLPVFKGGEQHLVGEYVMAAIGEDDFVEPKVAGRALRSVGIKVFGVKQAAQLAIANNHANLNTLFRDTRWRDGVWSQAAKRIPHAEQTNGLKFGGPTSTRCQRFPIRSIPHVFGENDVAEQPQAAAPQYQPDPEDFT